MFKIQQPAVQLYKAILDYGQTLRNSGPEYCDAYTRWYNHLDRYAETAARCGSLTVWQEKTVKIRQPLFYVAQKPPHYRVPFYFAIGAAVELLHNLTNSFVTDSPDRLFAASFAEGVVTLLEGQERHPCPDQLMGLNYINSGYYFNQILPGNQDSLYWTNAQEAINLFDDIIADENVDNAFRFLANSCKINLCWRLNNIADPRCGLDILDAQPVSDGQQRQAGDYNNLYIPVYRAGLFEVIGQTADILQMNETSFAVPIAGYNDKPNTTLTVFWAMHFNAGQLPSHAISDVLLSDVHQAANGDPPLPKSRPPLPLPGGLNLGL